MKKIGSVLIAMVLLFAFSGCNQKQTVEQSNKGESIVRKSDTKNVENNKVKEIKKGEVFAVKDYCELTINTTNFGKRINPPNPRSVYTYYEAKEAGTIYFDSVISVKNLLTQGEIADKFLSVKVMYDNKYEYKTFSAIEENGGSNLTYTNITTIDPLTNGVIHFLASVPEGVEKDNKPLSIIIKVNNQEIKYIVR